MVFGYRYDGPFFPDTGEQFLGQLLHLIATERLAWRHADPVSRAIRATIRSELVPQARRVAADPRAYDWQARRAKGIA